MDPGDPDEPSRKELVERVDQLEANQTEQREWWEDALPSRRGVLTAGAGLGLGALLTGSASGQSAAGQVGTPSSPEDLYAALLNVSDTGSDPASNGEFRRNGSDIKVYSGGGVRNLTDIGTGGGGDVSVSDDGTQIVPAASDLNFNGIGVTDGGDGTVTIGQNIDMGTL